MPKENDISELLEEYLDRDYPDRIPISVWEDPKEPKSEDQNTNPQEEEKAVKNNFALTCWKEMLKLISESLLYSIVVWGVILFLAYLLSLSIK